MLSAAHVVLLPDVRRRTELYRTVPADPSGRFRFERAPRPGSYRVFAWTDVDEGAWYDAEFMRMYESAGAPAQVEEGRVTEVKAGLNR